jgi:hypothetical protein
LNMKTRVASLLVFGVLVAVEGCGGSSGSAPSGPKATLRLLNDFVDVASVSGKVGGADALLNQPFGTISTYVHYPTGTRAVSFTDAGASSLLVSTNEDLVANEGYTAIGLGSAGKGRHVMYLTDLLTPTAGQARVRVLNGDEDAATVDVYVTPTATASLTGLTPDESAVAFLDGSTAYLTIAPGTYKIWITAAGLPDTIIVTNNVTFTAGQVETLLAIKEAGGVQIQEIPDGPSA